MSTTDTVKATAKTKKTVKKIKETKETNEINQTNVNKTLYWTTGKGEKILITDMTTEHLKRCLYQLNSEVEKLASIAYKYDRILESKSNLEKELMERLRSNQGSSEFDYQFLLQSVVRVLGAEKVSEILNIR